MVKSFELTMVRLKYLPPSPQLSTTCGVRGTGRKLTSRSSHYYLSQPDPFAEEWIQLGPTELGHVWRLFKWNCLSILDFFFFCCSTCILYLLSSYNFSNYIYYGSVDLKKKKSVLIIQIR